MVYINDVISGVGRAFTTLITLNYLAGQALVSVAKWIVHSMANLLVSLGNALHIILEDLAVFLQETVEGLVAIIEWIFGCVDSLTAGVNSGIWSGKALMDNAVSGMGSSIALTLSSIHDVSHGIGRFLRLTGSSFLLLVGLVPQTFHYLTALLHSSFKAFIISVGAAGHNTWTAVVAAPFEAVLGFLSATILLYSSIRLVRQFIQERQITLRHLAIWTFKAICIVYLVFIRGLICGVRGLAQTVEFTLSHLHVPRFHHAGDSDAEEEENNVDNDTVPTDNLDDSDLEETERIVDRRRNYDLLVQRRNERRSRSKTIVNKPNNEDVEALLFEQVEREREDKLCVICQDQEKCIMILPCRHLCICQDCQIHLMQRTNHNHSGTCPICRKNVKQTIKAYL